MSAQRKHKNLTAFLRYLKGELSPEERYGLERDLEADAFDKEAMEGFERIAPGDLEEDILSLHAQMRKRLQKRRRVALYGIAATVASILVVGTIFINIYDFNPEADKEAIQTEESLPREEGPAEKSQTARDQDTQKAEALKSPESVNTQETDERQVAAEPVREDFEIVAFEDDAVEDEAAEDEAAGVAAPQMARDPIPELAEEMAPELAEEMAPELAEEMAPVPEADEVLAVEAAPARRQKRAASKGQPVPSAVDQVQAAELVAGRVSGVVISAEDLNPLPGATVFTKDSDSGVITDMQGRFTIPAGEQTQTTVVASYVGMVTEEYQLDPGQENRVLMQPDPSTLDEVVVMAYGAQDGKYPVSAVQKVQVNQKEYESEYTGAEPVGGIQAYKMYMEKNIRFPGGDTLNNRGVVVLTFKVNPDGSISGIQTLRSPGESFSEEAIRLLEEGPPWNPAQDESGTTDDLVRMRIVFKK